MSLERPDPPIRTLLFDLDGTILDTIGLILASYAHVHEREFSHEPFDPEYYRSRIGIPLRGVFAERVGDDAERVAELMDIYRAHNREAHDGMVTAFDGVAAMLDAVRERGIRSAIVTSKMRDAVERGLRLAGLLEHFEAMVTVDDVVHHKPHPEPVVRALSLLGAQPGETMFIGDAPADIGCGRAAGVRTGAVLWGPFRADELIPLAPSRTFAHPSEIVAFLDTATYGDGVPGRTL